MTFRFACPLCGKERPFAPVAAVCSCGGNMRVEYDLERVSRTLTKESLAGRTASMWRYAELLPVEDARHIVSLGEGWTPLIRLHGAERTLPLRKLWVKREEQNPTGSFKARGFAAAVSVAKEHGMRAVAVNSNGNAASAMAAYAARAGMEAYVFLPKDCPGLIVQECLDYGAHTALVDGLIQDAGRIVREGAREMGWHPVGTLQEPGRTEGKKTMGLELAEQLGWRLPDVIIYPTGGGSGVIGMWNAFCQLKQLGLVEGAFPRIISVQEEGCAPVVDAMRGGGAFRKQEAPATSQPTGMRVPHPPDGQAIVSILRESGGTAVAVTKESIAAARRELGRHGVSASPEGAATWAALLSLADAGGIGPDDEVVLFNTSHAMKYIPCPCVGVPVVSGYRDWKQLHG